MTDLIVAMVKQLFRIEPRNTTWYAFPIPWTKGRGWSVLFTSNRTSLADQQVLLQSHLGIADTQPRMHMMRGILQVVVNRSLSGAHARPGSTGMPRLYVP